MSLNKTYMSWISVQNEVKMHYISCIHVPQMSTASDPSLTWCWCQYVIDWVALVLVHVPCTCTMYLYHVLQSAACKQELCALRLLETQTGPRADPGRAGRRLLVPSQRRQSPSVQGGGQEWPENAATVAAVEVFQCEWGLEVAMSDHLSLRREWPQLLCRCGKPKALTWATGCSLKKKLN
jgi:hypothetical protein